MGTKLQVVVIKDKIKHTSDLSIDGWVPLILEKVNEILSSKKINKLDLITEIYPSKTIEKTFNNECLLINLDKLEISLNKINNDCTLSPLNFFKELKNYAEGPRDGDFDWESFLRNSSEFIKERDKLKEYGFDFGVMDEYHHIEQKNKCSISAVII